MPKQVILGDGPRYWRDEKGNEVPIRPDGSSRIVSAEEGGGEAYPMFTEDLGPLFERGVHVGWSKDRYVEVGVAEFEVSTERHTSNAVFVTLDRDGINNAIHALRRARDAAFGKDA